MKIKALLFGLLIAGATATAYVTTENANEDYAEKKVDPRLIKVPRHG